MTTGYEVGDDMIDNAVTFGFVIEVYRHEHGSWLCKPALDNKEFFSCL
jgi:hypothetical protein